MSITSSDVSPIIAEVGTTFAMNTYTIYKSTYTSYAAYGAISYTTTTARSITGHVREITNAEIEHSEGYYHRGDHWIYLTGSYTVYDSYDFTISSTKYKIIDRKTHPYAGSNVFHRLVVRRID